VIYNEQVKQTMGRSEMFLQKTELPYKGQVVMVSMFILICVGGVGKAGLGEGRVQSGGRAYGAH
jgi:hypothetical protein